MKKKLMEEIEKHFRPEFLNRLDDVIVFHALTKDDLRTIVDCEFTHLHERAAEKGVDLHLSPEAIEYLIEKGYSPDFGARPLRRVIEHEIEDPLSEDILRGAFQVATIVTLRVQDNHLFFDAQPGPPVPPAEPQAAPAEAEVEKPPTPA
jgi:ATP-dependent Clp protease ATP-binding subunit ClpC